MSTVLRCYDYVNHPYAAVRAALAEDALGVFQRATSAAEARADALSAELHARIGPLDIAADIEIRVVATEEITSAFKSPTTRLTLEWAARRRPGLFPVMHAVLSVYALSATETQIELEGDYEPPLGLVGKAVDAAIGRRIADASVHRFVEQVAASLRERL
jgi:hypothetical protein